MKVFILAHQDDEVFLLPYILSPEKKLFIYLTNGVSAESSLFKLESRTAEAKYVFEKNLAKLNLIGLFCFCFKIIKTGIENHLCAKQPNLIYFDLWKLYQ